MISKSHVSGGRRGVALIIVLGFVALLSLLVAGLMETLRVRMIEGAAREQRATLRADADSAIDVVRARLAVFESDGNGIYLNSADLEKIAIDPLAGWTPPDGATVVVRLRDESGLFPINTTNTTLLRNLFESAGVGEDRAIGLADCLADWVDADNRRRAQGAEADAYGVPGLPANRPLRSFDELRLVRGFDQVFFTAEGTPNEAGAELEKIISFIDLTAGRAGTAASPPAGPNVNTAPESVLRAIGSRFGVDSGALLASRSPLDYPDDRAHQGVFKDVGDLARIAPASDFTSRVSYASRGIRIIVTVTKGDAAYMTDAIVASGGSNSRPVVVYRRSDGVLLPGSGGEYVSGSSAESDAEAR
jgi:hypothetical protein